MFSLLSVYRESEGQSLFSRTTAASKVEEGAWGAAPAGMRALPQPHGAQGTVCSSAHLVKSHHLQDGIRNSAIRKIWKLGKLCCHPTEGCSRSPDMPLSLIKLHFMKMHGDMKNNCCKYSNSNGTEWDLKKLKRVVARPVVSWHQQSFICHTFSQGAWDPYRTQAWASEKDSGKLQAQPVVK